LPLQFFLPPHWCSPEQELQLFTALDPDVGEAGGVDEPFLGLYTVLFVAMLLVLASQQFKIAFITSPFTTLSELL
jgi:hypothetical protein